MSSDPRRPPTVVAFVGPSLLQSDLDAIDQDLVALRPPIRRGDLASVMGEGYSTVVIIDGEFFQSLAVSPKELLSCLYSDVTIFGGASMGALRSAELYPYGMIGVGEIYRWYRSGRLTRDDDVAVTYGRLDDSYVLLNVPMVNVMWAMDCAGKSGWLDANTRRRITSAARRIGWEERSWQLVCQRAGLSPELTADVRRWAARPENNLKRLDALATLERATLSATAA